jgi:hypothetical protein
VVAELRKADLEAEPAGELTVHVARGLNELDADVAGAFAEYEQDPSRRDAVVAAAAADARAELERGLDGESFADVDGDLMPLLQPPFALRGLPAEPARIPFAEDLDLVYLVDRDGSRTAVTAADLARWGVPVDDLDRAAQANLVERTEPLLCEEELCGWASGDGYDATRLASPRLRADIVAEIGPAVYAVPREDVFVALPVEYADRIRQQVLQQFTQAERPVSKDLFVERDGDIEVLPPAP